MENWKAVPGCEGSYEVSDQGRVRSLDRVVECPCRWGGTRSFPLKGRVLKQAAIHDHLVVHIGKRRQEFVHRLVLMAFDRLPNDGEECRHLDGNPRNNRLGNLAWGSRSENIADRKRLGEENAARGEKSGKARLTEESVRYIRRKISHGQSYASLGRELGVNRATIRHVATGRCWGWLD